VDLFEMDAESIAFADNSFDHAVVPFVLSVVPNPEKMVSEVKRVTKSGGGIVIINHFASGNRFLSRIEGLLGPLFRKLGWRAGPAMDLLSNHCSLAIDGVMRKSRFDPWLIVNATNRK
jgi:phosphatidylethanolamine/phosphatidyl-N-methylethanolamine N-methyltransferase